MNYPSRISMAAYPNRRSPCSCIFPQILMLRKRPSTGLGVGGFSYLLASGGDVTAGFQQRAVDRIRP